MLLDIFAFPFRWLNCEDLLINHGVWTMLEDKKLLLIVQERGIYNWIDISVMLGTQRTPFQCLARYQRSLNPHILNKDWTEEEDNMLRTAVEIFGDKNWQLVASNLEGRTGTQCSNRSVTISHAFSLIIFPSIFAHYKNYGSHLFPEWEIKVCKTVCYWSGH